MPAAMDGSARPRVTPLGEWILVTGHELSLGRGGSVLIARSRQGIPWGVNGRVA